MQFGIDSFAVALFDDGTGTQAGGTFNPATYEGLLKSKKAIVVTARGGGRLAEARAKIAALVQVE